MFSTHAQLRAFAGRSEPGLEAARTSAGAILLLAILSLGAASCRHHHPVARAFVRPPSTVRPFVLPPSPQLPDPPELDAKSDAENPLEIPSDILYRPPPPLP